jgi:hypothetical protein
MHEVSYFCCLKHILETRQIGSYQKFVQPDWVGFLRLYGYLIHLCIPEYAFVGKICDFQA